jgi:2-(1,2-epoxy-1,2-dihydrophenyl)acetyl-CoA isomerase
MSSDSVRVERQGAVAWLELNRPDALNAFNTDLRLTLLRELRAVAADDSVRAVALTGKGRAFGAGADLREGFPNGPELERQLIEEYGPAVECIASMPKPVIVGVEGFATGVSIAHVLAADLVVMSEEAFLMLPFMNIALVPDGGLTWLLERRLGHQRAFELAIDGGRLSAARCQELGLVNRLAPKGSVTTAVLEWAQSLAAKPFQAVGRMKRLLRAAPHETLTGMQAAEARLQHLCIDSADCKEGVAAFLEKRAPKFS